MEEITRTPRLTEDEIDEIVLAGQKRLLRQRRRCGIAIDQATLDRTRDLEKRVLASRRARRKAA